MDSKIWIRRRLRLRAPALSLFAAGLLLAARPALATESVLVVASSTTARSASADYTCDGTADDVQIQQAIDALPSLGGTVYLTDGTFNLVAAIDLGDRVNVKLIGAGPATILKPAASADVDVITGGDVFDTTLEDFAIDGNAASNTSGAGLDFTDDEGAGLKVNRLLIHDTAEAAMDLAIDEVTITNSEIHDCADGIAFGSDCEKCSVIGCRIYQNDLHGIDGQGSYCRFTDNVVWANAEAGILLASGANDGHNCALDNEVYLNGTSGIDSGGSDFPVIIGNICYANGRKTDTPRTNAGILLRDMSSGAHTTESAIVIGNRCYDDTSAFALDPGALGQLYGIALEHDSGGNSPLNSIALGNDIRGNLTSGIYRGNVGAGVVLQKNLGDVTFAQGTATLTSAATTVTVTHGLSVTPTSKAISVTPASSLGSATKFHVSNVGATTFDIKVDTAPGSSVTFAWHARIYEEP